MIQLLFLVTFNKTSITFFMSSSMKDFLDKFFDLCREYQEEIPPQKMAEILRDYADRLDGWGASFNPFYLKHLWLTFDLNWRDKTLFFNGKSRSKNDINRAGLWGN